MQLYAHSLPREHGFNKDQWEPLQRHLERVGETAGRFAGAFGVKELGYIAGLLHDYGKASSAFQEYLEGGPRAPHSGAGARLAVDWFPGSIGRMLAFVIAGHHAGLTNGQGKPACLSSLQDRLDQEPGPLAIKPAWLARPDAPAADLGPFSHPPIADKGSARKERELERAVARSMFIRMLFSCLVDADRLETEKFEAGAYGWQIERGWRPDLDDASKLACLKEKLDRHLAFFDAVEPQTGLARLVQVMRAEVQKACRRAAGEEPGLFTLTVPTGGGKTLSSLAFALDHALLHGLRRVIYVIPYTSVIEQTAQVFRDALGEADAVLEHHSAFDWEDPPERHRDDEGRDGLKKLRNAAQNWDLPVIVTTAVQFFESLYANTPARCRKLHNLAGSVIVLDEAQTLPLGVLRPCLAALRELARGYGSSIVVCTATQPAILKEDGFLYDHDAGRPSAEAFSRDCAKMPVREIIPDPPQLYETLRRARVTDEGPLDDTALIKRLVAEPRVLCIVNSRNHARALFRLLEERGTPGLRHLSTSMTALHRRAVLDEIKATLAHTDEPVRVLATSLVEAGVDFSFPAVFRARAGLDAVAQAAGRCNREGELGADGGRVVVFDASDWGAPLAMKRFAEVGRLVSRHHKDDLLAPEALRAYFSQVYWSVGADALDGIRLPGHANGDRPFRTLQKLVESLGKLDRPDFAFADIGDAFRLIDDAQRPVIIPATEEMPYGAAEAVLASLSSPEPPGRLLWKLQTATVQIPRRAHDRLREVGMIECLHEDRFGDQFAVLTPLGAYLRHTGLDWSTESEPSAETLVL